MSTCPDPSEEVVQADAFHTNAPCGTALYGLRPIGLGRCDCESLRGYLIRLAAEHRIRPREMVTRVLSDSCPELHGFAHVGFFSRRAITVDGLGPYAQMFASALNQATGRRDLAQLTLLPWARLLPPKGQALLATHPRWCPRCLASSADGCDCPHWQLRWSITRVRTCTCHHIALSDRCPECNRFQPAIPRMPELWHCAHCGAALFASMSGAANEPQIKDESDESFIDDLIAVQSRLSADPLSTWLGFLNRAVAEMGAGQRAEFCRQVGLQQRALNGWIQKGQRVALNSVLQICSALRRSPSQIFGDASQPLTSRPRPPTQRHGTSLLRHPTTVRETVEIKLKTALVAESPPTLRSISTDFGVSRGYLRYWFPELVSALTQRRRLLWASQTERRHMKHADVINRIVQEALVRGLFPGQKLVERAVRRAGFSLMQPDAMLLYAQALCKVGVGPVTTPLRSNSR